MLTPSVRKIHNINSTKVIGLFYSNKMQMHLPFESTLERDWLLWLEYNPKVKSIVTQPHTFQIHQHERLRRYTPDVAVTFANSSRQQCYEVKPKTVAQTTLFLDRFSIHQIVLKRAGFELAFVTEDEIRREPQLTNLKRLSAYARGPRMESTALQMVYEWIANVPLSIGDAIGKLKNIGRLATIEHIYHAIFVGALKTDIAVPVTRDSLLELPEVHDEH